MRVLLDTCVISELVVPRPDPKVVQWVDSLDESTVFLSAITIGEIQRGVARLPDSARKQRLADWLNGDLLVRFQDRILPLGVAELLTWGTLVARLEAQGRPLPAMDSLIAAIALTHNLYLATRNESDFAGTGVPILNP